MRTITDLLPIAAVLGAVACGDVHADHMGPGPSMGEPTTTAIDPVTYDAVYVVNGADNSISVINAQTNEIAGTIAIANATFPHHLYLSPDRSKMLVAVPGMDLSGGHAVHEGHTMKSVVLLLDATTGATLRYRVLDAMNHNAIFAPRGGEAWTSQMVTSGVVMVLDANTLETKEAVSVGSAPAEVTFSADGTYAFSANTGSDSVTVIDVATKQPKKTISVGHGPVGAWQGANGIAYVDNEQDKTVTAIDTKTLEIKLTYKLGFTPGMAALAPNGELWVTDSDAGRVVAYMADSDMVHGAIPTGAGAHAIAFSADGKTGYVSNQLANTLSVIDLASLTVKKTIAVGRKPNGIMFRAR